MTPQDFHQMTPPAPQQVPTHPKPSNSRSQGTKHRVSVLTWNVGGLTSAFYTCFQEWLRSTRIDIIHLQETHWRFSNEWQTSEYNCIHSGCLTARAGVLTMVSKRLGHSDNITWQEPLPGRILHVFRPSNLPARDDFGTTMQSTLDQVPARNICITMGDLNTSLLMTSTKVGLADYHSATGRQTGPKHKDWRKWMHIIDHYDMTVLNSWSGQHGPTFISEHGSSRIDYLCCRGVHCDIVAKDVKQLWHHPMLPNSGCRHIPMTTTMISRWMPCTKTSPYFWTHSKKRQVVEGYQMQTPLWQKQVQTVTEQLHTLPMDPFVHDFNAFHNIVNSSLDPGDRKMDLPHPNQCQPQPNTVFRAFLYHSTMMKSNTKVGLLQVFQSWMHATKRQILKKQMDKVTRLNKKLKRQELFRQAHEASQAHDTHRFFGIIRKLSPRVPRKQIHLRGSQGDLLGPDEAATHLRDWYQAMYSDTQTHNYEPAQLSWPFVEWELSQSFLHLPTHKAVSPHFAPAPLWRSIRQVMTEKLQELGQHCVQQSAVPREWGRSTIIFLGKPGKSTSDAANLRPICLLEPCGKVLMRVLGMALRDQVWNELQQWPLFAYQPGRSSHDAIRRVLHHCCEVKQLQFMLQHRIHQAASGAHLSLSGGLTVSLDLSRAFDQVPRGKLFECLRSLHIDEQLLSFLWHIYQHTECEFEHRGCHRTFVASRGIRQGCSAAPTIWTLFTLAILKDLTQKIPEEWIKNNLTLFADDTCAHCVFHSLSNLQVHLKHIGILFDTLEEYGMKINVSKTAAILKGMGSALNKANRLVVKRTPQGSFLLIPRKGGTKTPIRLKSSHLYLGIMISYHNYERLSMDSRISAAKKTSSIIHSWIYTRGGLTLHQKARLWNQCVYPCLTAGILAVGINQHTLASFDAYCMKSLRSIYHAPVHLDHIPHHRFLTMHRLKDPLKTLLKLCKTTLQREQDRHHRLAHTDILQSWTPNHLQQCIQQIELCIQSRRQSVSSSISVFPYCCHHCDLQFETQAGLQAHLSKTHQDTPGQLRSFIPETDLKEGLPTCKRCQIPFTTWSALKHHIEYRCNLPLPQVRATEQMELQSQFASFIEAPAELEDATALCSYFRKYCSICLQFHGTDHSLKLHWKTYHPSEFSQMKIHYHLLTQHIHFRPTCQFCTSPDHHPTYSICTVIQNLAMLRSQKSSAVQPPSVEQAPFQCLHCDQSFKSKHGREQHYISRHGQGPSFDVLRDQNGTFNCSHCSATFKTSASLRRHIEQGSCPLFDATRTGNIEDTLDARIVQSVRDLMPSNVLEDPELLQYMSSCCCLCQQRFERKQDLHRHLASQHALLWHESLTTMQDLARVIRGDAHTCYCMSPGTTTMSSTKQSKHRCAVFSQFGLLMHHLGVPMNEHLIKQDITYAETINQAKKRRTASISPRMGPPRCTLDHYFLQTHMDRNPADLPSERTPEVQQQQQHTTAKIVPSRGTQTVELPVQEISSEPEGSDDPIAADQADLAEARTPDPLMTSFSKPKHGCSKPPHRLICGTGSSLQISPIFLQWCTCPTWLQPCIRLFLWSSQVEDILHSLQTTQWSDSWVPVASCVIYLFNSALISSSIIIWFMDAFPLGHSSSFTLALDVYINTSALWTCLISLIKTCGSWVNSLSSESTALSFTVMAEEGNFQQMMDIWSHVLPKDQLKRILDTDRQETEKRHKGRGHLKKQGQEGPESTQLLKAMMTLLLRHEDSIKCLNLDMEYMVHLNPGPGSILGELMTASKDWTNLKEKTAPLRHHLVVTMIDLLLQRFTTLTEAQPESELHQRALQYMLLDTSNQCPFLSWSPEKKQLIKSKTPALPMAEVLKTIQEIKECLQDCRVTLKFHSLRKMSNETDKAVPFLWTVSHRVAPNLWHLLQRLAFHSSWQLIQVHLRPANLQRSPLAKTLQQQLGKHWDRLSTAMGSTALQIAAAWGWLGWAKSLGLMQWTGVITVIFKRHVLKILFSRWMFWFTSQQSWSLGWQLRDNNVNTTSMNFYRIYWTSCNQAFWTWSGGQNGHYMGAHLKNRILRILPEETSGTHWPSHSLPWMMLILVHCNPWFNSGMTHSAWATCWLLHPEV